MPATVPAQRTAWEADVRAQDFAPPASAGQLDTDLAPAGERAAVPLVPVQSDAEAGAIAAHRQLARTARNAQAANGKTAPKSASRRRRPTDETGTPQQGKSREGRRGKGAPAGAGRAKGTMDGGGR
ncbi:hypothetical protein GCN74_27925 [Janthinobacterium sp. FT14W]|uniref:hypothetical protein n=1 Tax=Janthinobacterium sp. FT14W TaxID=2654253 RepID=UPI001264800A|nr:hypothetical protein [Janthinobacterium sp. FT14W]KAB8048565.1 hypothetical protein GCN74_27925 [Janthinobacterium sp. FT14W]